MNGLADAASLWGIEPDYFDVFGRRHRVSEEALARLIEAMRIAGVEPRRIEPATSPLAAYPGDGRRYWALAVQLYSVHSRRNWGIGDFTDLACLVDLAAARGAAAVGLNPLHALFIDRPDHASPYAPNSRLFLNPLYIDVDAVPEFPGRSARLNAEIAALRATERLAYARVAEIKLRRCGLRTRPFAPAPATRAASIFPLIVLSRAKACCASRVLRCYADVMRRPHGGIGRLPGGIPSVDSWRNSGVRRTRPVNSTNFFNGSPTANWQAAPRLRAGAACRSGFIPILRSGSTPVVPMRGVNKNPCCMP